MASQQESAVEPTIASKEIPALEVATLELIQVIEGDYDLPLPLECSLLSSGVNWVYLVSALEQKYVLRVARANRPEATFDESTYRFELELLNFLHWQGLPVAYPLARRDNEFLGVMNTAQGTHYYSLFSFAPGAIPEILEQAQAYLLGETLAGFHLAANSFSSAHSRFHLDVAFLVETPLRRLRELDRLAKEDMEYLEELCADVRASILTLPSCLPAYGIIHGDLWWKNVHFAGENLTLFDFDFCGYGWRAYDIGALQGTAVAFGNPLPRAVVESFIAGYQSVQKLREVELLAVPAFEKARIIWAFGLWASYIPVMGFEWFHELFDATLSNLKQWMQTDAE